jgi:dipeptidyl aminopeptidase/acylaminoacyl peptidase
VLALALLATPAAMTGQTKHPVGVADYGKFETLVAQPRAGLSPDGRWLAYGINRANRENELRIISVTTGESWTAAFGSQPTFSADSKWVAYVVGYSESQEEKLRRDKKPIHRKLGTLELATGKMSTVDGIESFTFNAAGTYLAMKRYAPERKETPDAAASAGAEEPPSPSTLVVRHLESGRDTTLGNVTDFAWQEKGGLLALAVGTEDKLGNGVQVFDPETGTLRVLDSAPAVYMGLTWRKDESKETNDLAVLRGTTDDRHEGPGYAVLAWKNLGPTLIFDPLAASSFPTGSRIVPFRRPVWSDDGRTVFVGVGRWEVQVKPSSGGAKDKAGEQEPDEPAAVEVWHAKDIDVMPRQKINARSDRQRSTLAAWHIDSNRFVPLGTDLAERIAPLRHQQLAYAINWSTYAMERTIGRPAADVYLVDIDSGARTKVKDGIDDQYLQASPGGRYLIYFEADHYWTIDTKTKAAVSISKPASTSFVNRESDATVRQKPAFGVAGWTRDDEGVILYDKFDAWLVAPDGSGATRLTDGATDQIRYRYVRLDPDEQWIDPRGPVYFSMFGIWSKKSGYARLDAGATRAVPLVVEEKSITNLGKAKSADVLAYTVQSFEHPPHVLVGGTDLNSARTVVKTNPFASDYAWGTSEILEYKNSRGDRLQGALFYPAGYVPGKKYPMVVYMYERLSDGVHRWSSPSDREPYNPAVFTGLGYILLQPDIVFRPRDPGLSVADCVGAAVKRVIAMGVVDPARIGIIGHSWGGFDTVFLATHTTLFAAGVAGAPITDLVSNYGNHHWSAGIAETDHIETGQQRMEVPLWEDLPAYIRNSAVFGVNNMKTPLLVAFGDNDGTVHWHQGVELYNIARRAKKDLVMLVYGGEDHSNRRKPNQLDYQRRIVQWFGHYLKGEPAEPWITSGVSYLDRERELKRLKSATSNKGS